MDNMEIASEDVFLGKLKNMILIAVCGILGRVSMTWDEVENIYASMEFPKVNETVDYILGS